MALIERSGDLPPFAPRLQLTRAAIDFAARMHGRQRRQSDESLFLVHPLEVAALLSGRGYGDDVVAAGVLHDVLEKTEASVAELRRIFGDRVAELVEAVSTDATIGEYGERMAALRDRVADADRDTQAVFAADKVAKTRELRVLAATAHRPLTDPELARRLEHYRSSLLMLETTAFSSPLVDQLRFELWTLRHLPPG